MICTKSASFGGKITAFLTRKQLMRVSENQSHNSIPPPWKESWRTLWNFLREVIHNQNNWPLITLSTPCFEHCIRHCVSSRKLRAYKSNNIQASHSFRLLYALLKNQTGPETSAIHCYPLKFCFEFIPHLVFITILASSRHLSKAFSEPFNI